MKFYKFFLEKIDSKIFNIIDLLNANIENYKEKDFLMSNNKSYEINYTFEYKKCETNYFFEIKCGKNTPNVCRDIDKKEYTSLEDNLYYINDDQIFIFVYRDKTINYVYISDKNKGGLFLGLLKNFNIKNLKIKHQNIGREEYLKKFKNEVTLLNKLNIKCDDQMYLQEFFTLSSGIKWDATSFVSAFITINLSSTNKKQIKENIDIITKNTSNFCGELSLLEGKDENDNIININENGFYESIFVNTDNMEIEKEGFFSLNDIYNKLLIEIKKRHGEK